MNKTCLMLVALSMPSLADQPRVTAEMSTQKLTNAFGMELSTNPLLDQNKTVADFGVLVASNYLSVAQAVRRTNGMTVVDVLVVDKLCHITVDESSDDLKAKAIKCDEGRIIPTGTKNN